jgi:sodium/pantothenate symporter
MNAYAIGILISLVAYVVIGNWAGRKVKHLDDFLVAGRRAPTLLILGTLIASAVGTGSFLGDSGFAYSGYVAALILQIPLTTAGYIFGSLFFGRYLRRSKSMTVAEFFGKRFASSRIRAFAAFTVIIGLGGYLMTVTQGSALVISQVTGFSYVVALIAVWLCYSAFTVYSGSSAVVITDTIMFLFFTVVAYLALSYIVGAGGGWNETVGKLASLEERPGIISVEGYQGPGANWTSVADMWVWASVMSIAWGVVFAISPWQSSRYLMAKDEHVVIRSGLWAAIALSILWPAIDFAGGAIAVSNPDIEPIAEAMIWAALNLMPVVAGAMLLTGIVAAGLSSASTFLTLVGFALTNDILGRDGVGKNGVGNDSNDNIRDDAAKLRLSRLAILVVGTVALVIALLVPPSIFWITFFVGPLFAASWGPIAFMSIWSPGVTEAGAFWGMVVGFFTCVVPKALVMLEVLHLPVILDPIVIGATCSILTIVIVSRRGSVSQEQRQFLQQLHLAPPELADRPRARRTRMLPKFLMAWGGLMSVVLTVFYVRPFQLALGQVNVNGGPFVVWSGELAAALFYGAALSFGGLAAHLALKRVLPA